MVKKVVFMIKKAKPVLRVMRKCLSAWKIFSEETTRTITNTSDSLSLKKVDIDWWILAVNVTQDGPVVLQL